MGDTWVTGLADLIGGEKDPRNLMIVFSVMRVILVEFDIVKHKEVHKSLEPPVTNVTMLTRVS